MAANRKAFEVVDRFESALCEYTGAPYCATTDSCTNALYLCLKFWSPVGVSFVLPKRTYVGVARAALNTGAGLEFSDEEWIGEYEIGSTLGPTGIIDAARWLRRGMYREWKYICLSFQATKHLPIGRGGAILCGNEVAANWFRKARFDGRDQNMNLFDQEEFGFGIHAYMPPDAAARGLWLMNNLKDHNDPIPGEYPDLSKKVWR